MEMSCDTDLARYVDGLAEFEINTVFNIPVQLRMRKCSLFFGSIMPISEAFSGKLEPRDGASASRTSCRH